MDTLLQGWLIPLLLMKYHGNCNEISHFDRTEIANATFILDSILEDSDYDKNTRPRVGQKPVIVYLSMAIQSFTNIKESNMEFTTSMFLRQEWNDRRLAHHDNGMLPVQGKDVQKIWRPDTYFTNMNDYKLYEDNQLALISRFGYVYYSSRLFVAASCRMYLQKFPRDVQKCSLILESFAFTRDMVEYRWKYPNPINILDIELAEFDLTSTEYTSEDVEYVAGKYRDMIVTFTFSRRIGYYLINFYVPCIIMVIMSWIVFWMDRANIGDRIALGITTVLTIVFLLSSSNSTMPRVSYPKAIDWYLMTSFIFVFTTLIMCLLIFRFDRRVNKQQCPPRSVSGEPPAESTSMQMPEEPEIRSRVSYFVADSRGAVYPIVHSASGLKKRSLLSFCFRQKFCGLSARVTRENLGMILNNFCRFLFPCSFLFFNLVYWVVIAN
ncbi:gamma-aminobutyric acid receptor subunit beta-like [Pocillopora damicornis]|uniref:gamma-aminobutyric acid receptor subunit beta-like n=1 Tax=Pocillopora damicornis TaxID=46731 RepID=UPI000F54DB8B|nr:gamma-aminobutyric acid receptor subunit beta-like [Pocillopora damicornis]XP_027056810.1 gamma-aminobutyric acid receptor subunit beta-like [Pocillopora damicornis]